MLIKPFDMQTELPEELQTILVNSGVSESKEKDKINSARGVFNKAGASLETAASQISNVMLRGETDSGRLRAAELVLRVHGILTELDAKPIPVINITISGEGNKTLVNLVLPTV